MKGEKPKGWKALGLFLRAGVFYVLLSCPATGFSAEVALHGASSLEDAICAVQCLTQEVEGDSCLLVRNEN